MRFAFLSPAAAGFAFVACTRTLPQTQAPAVVVRVQDGFRYEFHVVTGSECLIDLNDRTQVVRNVLPEHRDLAAQCRASLSQEFGVSDLEELRAGYATACFSNNDFVAPEFGLTRGFERFEPLYADEQRPYPWAAATHDAAAKWAEGVHASKKPFFLFVNDMEAHMPYTPPPEIARRFVRGTPEPRELSEAASFESPRDIEYALGVVPVSARQLEIMSDLYDAEIASLGFPSGGGAARPV
jgi:hypothetical protein